MKFFRRFLRILIALFILLNIVAAFHAYKFTHFYSDKNKVTKKPEDLSALEKAKVVFFGINFPKSTDDIQPDSAFETVYLTTKNNLKLQGWYFINTKNKGTVILFHGHGSSKSALLHESGYMHSIGYNVFLIDFRAHGASEGDVCTIGFKEAEDVKLAYDYIKQKGEKIIILWGISLGASTIIKAMHDYDDMKPNKLILEMPFGTLMQAVKGRMRTLNLPEQPFSTLLTFWGGIEQGFWAFNFNPCEYAKKITCPVLLQWGAKDQRVTKSEIDCIYNNLSSANKKLVIYESAHHESLYKMEHEKWRESISSFLAE